MRAQPSSASTMAGGFSSLLSTVSSNELLLESPLAFGRLPDDYHQARDALAPRPRTVCGSRRRLAVAPLIGDQRCYGETPMRLRRDCRPTLRLSSLLIALFLPSRTRHSREPRRRLAVVPLSRGQRYYGESPASVRCVSHDSLRLGLCNWASSRSLHEPRLAGTHVCGWRGRGACFRCDLLPRHSPSSATMCHPKQCISRNEENS